jgi:hypothetical protein
MNTTHPSVHLTLRRAQDDRKYGLSPFALSLSKCSRGLPSTGSGRSEIRAQPERGSRFIAIAFFACVSLLSGCAIQPWVKPYERERLADPVMRFSRDTLSDKHREHVREVREGARGATGVQGSGCGCN